jgi:hypothetical protein
LLWKGSALARSVAPRHSETVQRRCSVSTSGLKASGAQRWSVCAQTNVESRCLEPSASRSCVVRRDQPAVRAGSSNRPVRQAAAKSRTAAPEKTPRAPTETEAASACDVPTPEAARAAVPAPAWSLHPPARSVALRLRHRRTETAARGGTSSPVRAQGTFACGEAWQGHDHRGGRDPGSGHDRERGARSDPGSREDDSDGGERRQRAISPSMTSERLRLIARRPAGQPG